MRLPKHRLFDFNSPGKGIEKDAPPKKGIALFFDILLRRFWKLVTLNLIFFAFSIPALIIGYFLFSSIAVFAAGLLAPDAESVNTLFSNIGVSTLCAYVSCIYAAIFGTGPASAGMTYVIRNYRIDTHSWVWADYWYYFKKKFFKSLCVYVFDTVLLFLLCVNFCFYGSFASNNLGAYLLQGLMVVIFIIFLLMHAYIYPILITTEDKLFSVYKKALILAIGKLPLTFVSIFACSLFCALITGISWLLLPILMVIIPVIMFSFSCYINLFITYPVVERYILTKKEG